MKLKLIILLLITALLQGCGTFRPGWLSPEGELGGHFEGEEWIPDNPNIAFTYRIPDISSGMLYDVRFNKVTPSIQIELVEFDTPLPWLLSTWKVDTGVAYQRVYGYTGILFTSIFEISAGVAAGWNFEENDWFIGPNFTIIKF
jgi:hypothetical protein